ncbi:hypothetical protein ACF1GS_29820 [Streptomyces eurythermus]|uniref:hypothetical protein n=1 Tax=Streptomyces eurythermus TaxID=42237 RepID=UPI0036F67711
MTPDNVPAPAGRLTPSPSRSSPPWVRDLTAAIGQGAVQGAARSITDRLVDTLLINPPDWLRGLWHALPTPRQ